jgi:hypothetical protein
MAAITHIEPCLKYKQTASFQKLFGKLKSVKWFMGRNYFCGGMRSYLGFQIGIKIDYKFTQVSFVHYLVKSSSVADG